MKKISLILILFLSNVLIAQQVADPIAVELSRRLSKDLFDSNGVAIMQPSVEVLNATSNSRFFYTAKVANDEDWHFRFGLHFMSGNVPNSFRSFEPSLPTEEFQTDRALEFIDINIFEGNINSIDTIELANYIFKTLLYDGVNTGQIQVPDRSATLLGKSEGEAITIEDGSLEQLARARFDSLQNDINALTEPFGLDSIPIPQELEDQILNTLNAIPPQFSLVPGGDIQRVFAGVPQLDVMYKGFELNLRYIPKLNYGSEFGDFGFFGIGFKHMISKYFYEKEDPQNWRLAIQFAYQRTSLENTIGETNAELKSDADILNFNIHSSKMIKNWFEVFAGISYEQIDIETSYKYTLPIEIQQQLMLVDENKEVRPPEYPGDQNPQTAVIPITDTNIKGTFGINRSIGFVDIFATYSISQFNIFSFGVAANF